jgi:hypothetical protein
MKPIGLRRHRLAWETAGILNRLGRTIGRQQKAFVIVNAGAASIYELHYPGVDQNEVLAILRLLLAGYRNDEITPIMIARARERPRLERRPG